MLFCLLCLEFSWRMWNLANKSKGHWKDPINFASRVTPNHVLTIHLIHTNPQCSEYISTLTKSSKTNCNMKPVLAPNILTKELNILNWLMFWKVIASFEPKIMTIFTCIGVACLALYQNNTFLFCFFSKILGFWRISGIECLWCLHWLRLLSIHI